MRKRRKDYRVEVGPEPLTGMPGSLLVNFLHDTGDLAQAFDFSAYSAPSRMAAEIALAFRHHHATSAASTRYNTFRNAGIWFQFLDAHDRAVASMKEVDEAVLRAFIAWLDRQLHSKGARYVVWSSVKQLFAWLLRHRPELMHPGLELPFNPFPRKNAEAKPREALEQSEIEAVLAAARADIEASWALFTEGERALASVDRAAIAREPDLGRLDLKDLGALLAVIIDRFEGLVPTHKAIWDGKWWPLHYALQHHGYANRVARYLHTVPETLIPYMIAIGAQTYANPEALRLLRRDCMSEHLVLDRRVVVSWRKGRSSREQRRSFLRDRSVSAPNLIDRVLAMTERLVPHVPARREKRALPLCERPGGGRGR